MTTGRLSTSLFTICLLFIGCSHRDTPSPASRPDAQATHSPGANHGTEALLLTCMDYRLIDETERYMADGGLRNQYDQVILAGASLGATTEKRPSWSATFWEHLDVAVDLHSIRKVIVIDHRDCGAFRVFLGEDFAENREKETAVHTTALRELARRIHAKQPDLEVELHIMSLDGTVEDVSEGM